MFTHRLEYRLWRRRRIVLALLALLLLAAALHGGAGHAHHRHDARKAATSRTARDRHGAARVRRPRISGKERNPAQARTGTAGTGLRWADFHGIQLPYSATDGP